MSIATRFLSSVFLAVSLLPAFLGADPAFAQENEATRAPKASSFATQEDQVGAVANSVNLFTGDLNVPITLAKLPGGRGPGGVARISYGNTGVKKHAETWNREAPTSKVGLGWSLPNDRIVVDHGGTGSRYDDKFYLHTGGQSIQLLLVSKDEGNDVWTFKTKPYQFWKVRYDIRSEAWRIVKEDGTTYVYGNRSSGRETVQWGIKWGNWIGNSGNIFGQDRYATAWNISKIEDRLGEPVRFTYQAEEERVGEGAGNGGESGDESYTKMSYLKEIEDAYGRTIEFVYAPKIPGLEYEDPHEESGEPDAYQEHYATKYLDRVKVDNAEGNRLFSVDLIYEIRGELSKRYLTAVTHETASGESLPGYRFDYDESENSNSFGSLEAVTTPSGAVVQYNYQTNAIGSRHRPIPPPSNAFDDAEDQATPFVTEDYTAVAWYDRQGENFLLAVYEWDGEWTETELVTLDNVETSEHRGQEVYNVEIFTEENYIVAVKGTPGSQNSDYKHVYVFSKDERKRNAWDSDHHLIETGESFVQVVTGDRFFTVLSTEYGHLYRYMRGRENEWSETQISGQTSFVEEDENFITGMNNYYILHRDGTGSDYIDLWYHDQQGNWKSTSFSDEVKFDGDDDSDDDHFWYAAPSFAAVMAVGTNEYLYTWDEEFEGIQRSRGSVLGAVPDDLPVYTMGNAMVGLDNYDGHTDDVMAYYGGRGLGGGWASRTEFVTTFGYGYALGGERGNPSEMRIFKYDANTNRWKTEDLSDNPSNKGRAGIGYFVYDNRLYTRQRNGTWDRKGALPSPSCGEVFDESIVTSGMGFLAYGNEDGNEDCESEMRVVDVKNGSLIDIGTVPDVIIQNGIYTTVRKASRTLAPSSSSGGAQTVHLYHVSNGEVEGAYEDLVVSSVEVDDGYEKRSTHYQYSSSTATVASSALTARYNEVEAVVEPRIEYATTGNSTFEIIAEKPFGSTTTYFFNGLPEEDGAHPFPEGTTPHYGLLTGSSYATETYDSSGNVVASSEQVYESYIEDIDGTRRAYWVRPTGTTQMRDGVETSVSTRYDQDTGLPDSKQTGFYDAEGIAHQKAIYYERPCDVAHYNTLCSQEHLFTPVVQTTSYIDQTVEGVTATVWDNDWVGTFDGTWAPKTSYQYIGSPDAPRNAVFDDWNGATPDASNWLQTSEITRRNQYGQPIETTDVENRPSTSIHGFDGQVAIGSFADARYAQVLVENFDDGSTSDGDPENWYRTGGDWSVADGALYWTSRDRGRSGLKRKVAQQEFVADFDMRILAGSGNQWSGLLFRKEKASDHYYESGYMVILRADGSVELYEKSNRLCDTDWSSNSCNTSTSSIEDVSRWHQFRVEGNGRRIRIFVDGEKVIDKRGSSSSSGKTYVGFSSGRSKAQFDNLRVYPLDAQAQTVSHDSRTKRVQHQTGPRGERVYTSFDDLGHQLGTVGPTGVPQQTVATYQWNRHRESFSSSVPHQTLQTKVRGTEGAYENFEQKGKNSRQGGLLRWIEKDKSNGTPSYWEINNGRLVHSSPNAASNYRGDFFYTDIGHELKGRVAVEVSVRSLGTPDNWNLGLALGGDEWLVKDGGSENAIWTAFYGFDRWRSYQGGWRNIAVNLDREQTYRLKIVVDVPNQTADYYLDGRLMASGRSLRKNTTGIQKLSLFNYARGAASEWSIDEVMVYTDPVHQVTYTDNAGRTRQAQTEEEGAIIATETNYDEAGRPVASMRPKRIDGAHFGYRTGLSGTYGTVEYEDSPLSRKTAEYAPGNGDHPTTYRYRANQSYYLRNDLPEGEYYRTEVTDPDGHKSVTLTTTSGQTVTKALQDQQDYSQITSYEYDLRGNTTRILPPNYYDPPSGQSGSDYVTETTYDDRGRPVETTTPDGGTKQVIYDRVGRKRFALHGDAASEGQVLYWKYDEKSRVVEEGTFAHGAPDDSGLDVPPGIADAKGGVVISKVHYDSRCDDYSENGECEFVELTNVSDHSINLNGWRLVDAAEAYQYYKVRRNHVLSPGERAVFANDRSGAFSGNAYYQNNYGRSVDFDLWDQRSHLLKLANDDNGAEEDDALELHRPSGDGRADYVSWGGTEWGTEDEYHSGTVWSISHQGAEGAALVRTSVARPEDDGGPGPSPGEWETRALQQEGGGTGGDWDRNFLVQKADDADWPSTDYTWHRRYTYGDHDDPLYTHNRLVKTEVNSDAGNETEVRQSFGYDVFGRTTRVSQQTDHSPQGGWNDGSWRVTRYAYDNLGNRTEIVYPVNTLKVVYQYDVAGRLSKIGKPGNERRFAEYAYGTDGRLKTVTLDGTNISCGHDYDNAGRLKSKACTKAGSGMTYFQESLQYTSGGYGGFGSHAGLVARMNYSYSGTGAPVGRTWRYDYDDLGRLKTAADSRGRAGIGVARPIRYDPNGNIRSLSRDGNIDNYTYYDGTNRLKNTDGSGTDYQYDARGGVTRHATRDIASITRSLFTGKPERIAYESGSYELRYQYGAGGERVYERDAQSGRETIYLRAGGGFPLAEIVRSEETRLYVRGPGGIVAQKQVGQPWRFVLKDHLGSTRAVVASGGAAQAFLDYGPFGRVLYRYNEGGARYQFTGHEAEEQTGLHNFRARLYDPAAGRFLSVDAAGQFHSPYSYAGGNPISYVDPNGRFFISASAVLIGAAIGAAIGGGSYSIGKAISGEKWRLGEFAKETAIGGVAGAASAGAGAAVSGALGSGVTAGIASNAAGYTASYAAETALRGNPFSAANYATGLGISAGSTLLGAGLGKLIGGGESGNANSLLGSACPPLCPTDENGVILLGKQPAVTVTGGKPTIAQLSDFLRDHPYLLNSVVRNPFDWSSEYQAAAGRAVVYNGQLNFMASTLELSGGLGTAAGAASSFVGYHVALVPGLQGAGGTMIVAGRGLSTAGGVLSVGADLMRANYDGAAVGAGLSLVGGGLARGTQGLTYFNRLMIQSQITIGTSTTGYGLGKLTDQTQW